MYLDGQQVNRHMKNGVTMNCSNILYFDNAATTPLHPEVITEITETLETVYGNPSSQHSIGQKAKNLLCRSRTIAANQLNCKPEEIIFTSGACEANSLAIKGYMDYHNTTLITTKLEHKSILFLCETEPYDIQYASVDSQGLVRLEELENLCKEICFHHNNPFLVSIHAANSETGTIQDITSISTIVHQYNGILHTDATQLFPYTKLDVEKLGIDLLSISGQKLHAPKGIGLLYVRDGISLQPLIYGSQMEYRRGGTENIPYIAGFAKAIQLLDYDNHSTIQMRDYLLSKLKKTQPDCRINGSLIHRLPNNVNVSFPGVEGEGLAMLLDSSGICVSTASACNSISLQPSAVLQELGVPEDYIHGTIRITLPKDTAKHDIDYFITKLNNALSQLRDIQNEILHKKL